jgi:UDP-glucose 4-epimerase
LRAIVTGAAGLLAAILSTACSRKATHRVVGFDNFSTAQAEFLAGATASPVLWPERCDLLDKTAITGAIEGCDFVFHMPANADVRFGLKHPRKDLEQNTIATWNALEAMRATGVRRIILSSTGSVYGESRVFLHPRTHLFQCRLRFMRRPT